MSEKLRVGDLIEFYEHHGTVGDNRWLRREKVIGIGKKNGKFRVFVENYLPPICEERPLEPSIRKLPDGAYKKIKMFDMEVSGHA